MTVALAGRAVPAGAARADAFVVVLVAAITLVFDLAVAVIAGEAGDDAFGLPVVVEQQGRDQAGCGEHMPGEVSRQQLARRGRIARTGAAGRAPP